VSRTAKKEKSRRRYTPHTVGVDVKEEDTVPRTGLISLAGFARFGMLRPTRRKFGGAKDAETHKGQNRWSYACMSHRLVEIRRTSAFLTLITVL
jgi:hypothetical protein